MERNSFEYCCGAEELGILDGLTAKELKGFLATQASLLKAAEDPNDEDSMDSPEDFPGAYIATTIPQQKVAIRALRANKFKQVFTFTNPGTGNKVTLWARKLVRG